jgi:4-amino-4-deoxy-L-arabinose transferase-like glycosyltransferase
MKVIRDNIFLILVILLAVLLRFLWLDKIPNAIGGDELVYIVTAKSIFLKWTDLTGLWNPLSIFSFHYPPGEGQAELPYFLLAPIVGPANFSLLASRFLYAILSTLSVLLIYLISKKLFSKSVAVFAGFIAAINPWFLYIGRTNYETVPAMFFFLLSFYILLIARSWKILISLPFLAFAFYSYIGTKLIFLPFVLIAVCYAYLFINKKKYLKQYLIVFLASLLLVLFFVVSIKGGNVGLRQAEILFPNNSEIISQVDSLRKASIQTPFLGIFDNKFSLYSEIVFTKALNSLSFNYLFVKGDNFYNIGHGFFYLIDAIFLVIGLGFVFFKKREKGILLTLLILLGLIPEIFHGSPNGGIMESFAPHLMLIFPFLAIFIGAGLDGIFRSIKSKKIAYPVFGLIGFVYLFFLLNFLNLYFFQFSLRDNFDFHVRPMSNYVKLASGEGKEVILYSPKFRDEFRKYIFYSNMLNSKTSKQIEEVLRSDRIKFNNIEFLGCNNTIDPSKTNKVIVYDYVCGSLPKENKHLTIARLFDGGESYRIYNDNLCSVFNLKQFPSGVSVGDFAIETMSSRRFCETFVASY